MSFADSTIAEDAEDHFDEADKDAPLRADIRRLGRILGDVVRDQEGSETFALIEQVRRTALRFHRDEDQSAHDELEQILHGLSRRGAINTIAPSATSPTSPTSPRTSTTSAATGRTSRPDRRRATARWRSP